MGRLNRILNLLINKVKESSVFMFHSIKKNAVEALFPRFCVRCKQEGCLLCDDCFVSWNSYSSSRIERVSKDIEFHFFSFAYADKITRNLICAWKYEYDLSAWEILKRKIIPELSFINQVVSSNGIEAIIPVPLHRRRFMERGFDQAEEISHFLCKELKIAHRPILQRVRRTGKQAERSEKQRVKTMIESPFVCLAEAPKSVLLIDDVWTTGSTASAAAKALRNAGVEKVIVYTLAKG